LEVEILLNAAKAANEEIDVELTAQKQELAHAFNEVRKLPPGF